MVVFGLVVLALLTATDPVETAEETTTTLDEEISPPTTRFDRDAWTVARIETEIQPSWSETALLEGWSHGVYTLDGQLVYIGSSAVPYQFRPPQGLIVYQSSDGESWTRVETNIEEGVSILNARGADGVVVISGIDSGGRSILFQSYDGTNWVPVPLPDEVSRSLFNVVGVSKDRIVIFDSFYPIATVATVIEALPEDLAENATNVHVDHNRVVVHGPAGLIMARYTAEELGLTLEDLGQEHPVPQDEITVWSLVDGSWQQGNVGANWIDQVHILDNGELLAVGHGGPSFHGRWRSTNGVVWTVDPTPGQYMDDQWNDGYVGITPARNDLVYSDDLTEWESMGLSEILPQELRWDLNNVDASESGVAAIANTWETHSVNTQPADVVRSRAGYQLVYQPNQGRFVVRDGDDVLMAVTSGGAVSEHLFFDLTRRTVDFLHPGTGDIIFTFSFDELEVMQSEAWPRLSNSIHHMALLVTRDGENWIVDDIGDLVGSDWIQSASFEDNRIVLVSVDNRHMPTSRVWVGTLP